MVHTAPPSVETRTAAIIMLDVCSTTLIMFLLVLNLFMFTTDDWYKKVLFHVFLCECYVTPHVDTS